MSRLKIEIYGEGKRRDVQTDSWGSAESEFRKRISEAMNVMMGYNKTWVKVTRDGKMLLSDRIDLNSAYMGLSIKGHFRDEINRAIRHWENVKDAEKISNLQHTLNLLTAMDDSGNAQDLYSYKFMHEGKQIHGYELAEPATDKEIKTTIAILEGREQGYGSGSIEKKQGVTCVESIIKFD